MIFFKNKLTFSEHVQADDVLHKFDCKMLKDKVMSMAIIPTNNKYFHIKSNDEENLKKYAVKKTYRCWD